MVLQLPNLSIDELTKEVLIFDIRRRLRFGTLSSLQGNIIVPLQHAFQTSTCGSVWSPILPAVDAPTGGHALQ
eukprot:10324615-Lingulodinium_polyedra.AAC.1